jgi:hypothetical protein
VFGVAFDAIDMADVVPQENIRKLLKSAAATEAAGDRNEAMADLVEAFDILFHPYAASQYTAYGFAETIQANHGRGGRFGGGHANHRGPSPVEPDPRARLGWPKRGPGYFQLTEALGDWLGRSAQTALRTFAHFDTSA